MPKVTLYSITTDGFASHLLLPCYHVTVPYTILKDIVLSLIIWQHINIIYQVSRAFVGTIIIITLQRMCRLVMVSSEYLLRKSLSVCNCVHLSLCGMYICYIYTISDGQSWCVLWVRTTVFRGMWNFEPSWGICPSLWNYYIFAEFGTGQW